MNIAILISGLPRFTREFQDFLENIQNYDRIDWFFLLWDTPPSQDLRIPPSWPYSSPEHTKERIEKHLPERSNIKHLEIAHQPVFNINKPFIKTEWSVIPNILTMYYGIEKIFNIQEQCSKDYGEYDLIIRARPDVGIDTPLDMRDAKSFLDSHDSTILMPRNHRFGLRGFAVNDLFAIGKPSEMKVYSSVFSCQDAYIAQQVPFHGETLLAHHLLTNNINVPITNFQSVFRCYTNNGETAWTDDSLTNFGYWNS